MVIKLFVHSIRFYWPLVLSFWLLKGFPSPFNYPSPSSIRFLNLVLLGTRRTFGPVSPFLQPEKSTTTVYLSSFGQVDPLLGQEPRVNTHRVLALGTLLRNVRFIHRVTDRVSFTGHCRSIVVDVVVGGKGKGLQKFSSWPTVDCNGKWCRDVFDCQCKKIVLKPYTTQGGYSSSTVMCYWDLSLKTSGESIKYLSHCLPFHPETTKTKSVPKYVVGSGQGTPVWSCRDWSGMCVSWTRRTRP